MATAKEQLLANMNPQAARLLDQQMRDQQVAQRSQGAGMLSGLVQAYTGMGDTAQRALGTAPMGANELQLQAQQKAAAAQKQKKALELETLSKQAEQVIYGTPQIGAQAASNMLKALKLDKTGKLAEQIINKYATPDLPEKEKRFLVAGNNVWDSEKQEFRTAPATGKKETLKSFQTLTGIDLDDYTSGSNREVAKIMANTKIPLEERITQATDALIEKDDAPDGDRVDYYIKQLEAADIDGTLSKIETIDQQAKLIEDGIMSGFGSEVLKTVAKMGATLGVLDESQINTLANTETFDSNAGNLVAQVIKAFGAGTGLSDADREYAAKIAGGTIALNEISLKRILDIASRRSISEIKRYNEKLRKLGGEWLEDVVEVPRFRRLDITPLLNDPNAKVKGADGNIYYIDRDPRGYTTEVYDANGFLIPSRPKKP